MKKHVILIALGIILAGTYLFINTTVNGIGLSPDSATYVDTARSILAGKGIVAYDQPMVHYPPVYPFFLMIGKLFSDDLVVAARWLHLALYLVNAIMYSWLIHRTTKNEWLALLFLAFFFVSRSILQAHTYAWSEALYLFFCVVVLLLVTRYRYEFRFGTALALAFFSALAIGTRIIGVVLIPTVMLTLLLMPIGTIKQKASSAFQYLILVLLAIAPYFLRNYLLLKQPTNRVIVFHPVGLQSLLDMVSNAHNFLLPETRSYVVKVFEIMLLLAAMTFLILKKINMPQPVKSSHDQNGSQVVTFSLIFSVLTVGVTILTISFFDASTTLDSRILLPAFLFTILALVVLVQQATQNFMHESWVMTGVAGFIILTSLAATIPYAGSLHRDPANYNSDLWQTSSLLAQVRKIDQVIASNGFDVITLKTVIPARPLPQHVFRDTTLPNNEFELEARQLCEDVFTGTRKVVFFKNIYRSEFLNKDEFEIACQGLLWRKFSDGWIVTGLK